MRRLIVAAAFVFILQLPSIASAQLPGGPQAPVAKATIEGTVVRATTGEALPRTQITINRIAPPPQGPGQPAPAGQPGQQPGQTGAAGTPAANPAAGQSGQRGANPQATPANAAAAQGATASIAPVFTDDQGKFQMKDLEPGTYRLYAARNGFTKMEYGQKLMNRPGTVLNITAGQSMKDVAFKLTPAGTVTGRVVDEQGEPIPGITVQVLRSTYDQTGKRTLQPTGSAKTNDLGEYRVYYVAPGRYYVSANAATSGIESLLAAAGGTGVNGNEVIAPGYVQTYYPNTTDASRSVAIDIQPGSEISAIHFTLVRQQRFRVKGRVMDLATGRPPQTASLSLTPRNSAVSANAIDSILGGAAGGNNYNTADGTFELRDVAPGSYWLQVLATGTPPAGGAQSSTNATAAILASISTAMMPLDVSGADVENLTVTTGGGVLIPGKIQLEGETPAGFALNRLVVGIQSTNGVVSLASQLQLAQPSEEGVFSVDKLTAGEYRFAVLAGLGPNMYIKSARFDQTDILDSGITITDKSPGTLQVTISRDGGRIDGTVLDKDSKPVLGVTTVLIPDRNRSRRDVYKGAVTDQTGHFTMVGITPGDYKLFAWEDIEPFSFNDPEVLRQFEDRGKPIHIAESAKEMVGVRLIPAVTP